MGWEPVLDGKLADDAMTAVREIGDAIADHPEMRPEDATVFWAYVAGVLDDDTTAARYDAATNRLLERIEGGYGGLQLYGGLAGAGWVLAHVSDGGADEFLDAVDETLIDILGQTERWERDYDLIQGLTGWGVYFLERATSPSPAPRAREGVAKIVDALAAIAVRDGDLVSWHTGVHLLPPWQAERWPDGYYNVGVAHGVPGTVAMLGRVVGLPDAPPLARELCEGAARWVRTCKHPPPPAHGWFPSSQLSMRGGGPDRARNAWCYGDLGIAAAMWLAAIHTGAPIDEWRALAVDAATRPPEACGVRDPGLCHGALGLAHVCNRFYQASGDPVFRDAARGWVERGLAMRRADGVAGFSAWRMMPGEEAHFEATPDFLEGAAGCGLALLAAARGGDEPGWDRVLLSDIPTRKST
jgi:hypothetical protein